MRKIKSAVLIGLAALSSICPAEAASAKPVLIENVPHVLQKEDFCGEACVEMYLQKLGCKITQDDVFDVSGLDPMEARGCHTKEMVTALKKLGIEPGTVWHKIKANSADELNKQWMSLLADLQNQVPSIVCMRTGKGPGASEHFRLVLGYDTQKQEVIYHEPAEARGGVQTDEARLLPGLLAAEVQERRMAGNTHAPATKEDQSP